MGSEFEKLGERASKDPSVIGYVLLTAVIVVGAVAVAMGLVWQVARQAGMGVRDMALGQVTQGEGTSSGGGPGTNGGGL